MESETRFKFDSKKQYEEVLRDLIKKNRNDSEKLANGSADEEIDALLDEYIEFCESQEN